MRRRADPMLSDVSRGVLVGGWDEEEVSSAPRPRTIGSTCPLGAPFGAEIEAQISAEVLEATRQAERR
jgi:hypothetical protein